MGGNIWDDIEVGFGEHHYADQEMVCVVVGLGKDGSIQRGMLSLRVSFNLVLRGELRVYISITFCLTLFLNITNLFCLFCIFSVTGIVLHL